MGADSAPISLAQARQLFSRLKSAPALVVAVSGGPDSTALLFLLARWRKSLRKGPKLLAVTIDHGLRPESAKEARAVGALAKSLGVPHRILKWRGAKPRTGIQAAARAARYRLLAEAAHRFGATRILTAHSRDDQAETVLMRLSRGSGIGGLSGMAREAVLPSLHSRSEWRGGVGVLSLSPRGRGWLSEAKPGEGAQAIVLVRPLLSIPKSRLVATLQAHDIAFADDASNRDPRFTRVRWRALMQSLEAEGLDARTLARLAKRAGRAEAALDLATLGAERALVRAVAGKVPRLACDRLAFAALPEEIRLRLLGRMIDRAGTEGPVELGKCEALLAAVDGILSGRGSLKRTLAGAVVALEAATISVAQAPARRHFGPRRRQKAPRKA